MLKTDLTCPCQKDGKYKHDFGKRKNLGELWTWGQHKRHKY